MIRLGLRLVIGGGREAVTRLVILAVAVGLGTGLLLTAVAETNAVTAWNHRNAWYWTGTAWVPPGPADAGIAPLWWHPSAETFNGKRINRFDVAATGASSPAPPGIPHDPGPGQYYASPALAALLRSTPADQLADRYPGHLAGPIGEAALPSPNSLVIIVGRTPAQLAGTPYSLPVTSIATAVPASTVPSGNNAQANPKGLDYFPPGSGVGASTSDLILSVVALAVLVPALIFIATATRLSAARREQRFAAMRLVGATRKQVSLLAAVESTAAAVAGVALGFGIFFLLRVPVAGASFAGEPFFSGELSLSTPDILAVAVGVPVAAAVAARLALRRVHISPLGVARRVTPKPPRAWRVLPLLAGLAELGFFTVRGHPASIPGQVQEFVSGFLLLIVGLIVAGPWLTMAAARIMARWTSRPGALIAARRLADDPRAAFRAVSGLVLALFLTTVAVVFMSTQDAKDLTQSGSPVEASVVTDQLADQQPSDEPQGNAAATGVGPAAPAAPLTAHGFQQLTDTVILVSLLIAGCTLAAGIAAGLADRKRPFSLLRLTGARLAMLRRVVALEGAIPLLAVAAVAIGTGFGGAAMLASEAQQHPMAAPGAGYYLITAGGILLALGIIAATFPLLARITGPEVARNQ